MHQIIRPMVTVTVTQTSQTETTQQQTNPTKNADTTNPTESTNYSLNDLTITPSCITRIQQLASQRPNPNSMYLRLYVDAGGCSGFQYKFLLLSEDDPSNDEEDGTIDPEEDIVYNVDGARLVIDQTSLELLRGSTIDYVQEMIRSSFAVVNNPNSESACGCGSSFAVKKFQANPALD
jgi:iron-sulfur cluster assembly accessory protein